MKILILDQAGAKSTTLAETDRYDIVLVMKEKATHYIAYKNLHGPPNILIRRDCVERFMEELKQSPCG